MDPRAHRRLLPCLSLTATVGLSVPATAAAPARDPIAIDGLELADGRIATPPVPAVWGGARPATVNHRALGRLRAEAGPAWIHWDAGRRSTAGIIPTRIDAPGVVHSATHAEAFALAFVDRHLALLAPGSVPGDFAVVANELSSGIRTVGLRQHHHGIPVHGGQVSLRFKGDRLVLVASQALPEIAVPSRTAPVISPASARAQALTFIERDWGSSTRTASAPTDPMILPLWTGSAWRYHEVVRVEVFGRAPLGRWAVWLDATTGTPVAREQLMRSAATVRFDVPLRHPGSTRYDALAPGLDVTQGGAAATTDTGGQVALDTSPTTLDTSVDGPLVEVLNDENPSITASFPVSDGETVTWSVADTEFDDAQLSGFIHAGLAKEYVRPHAPDLAWLDDTFEVNVNLDGSCNAISDGNSIYFLRAGDCQNTARLADVVYHEAGHSVHRAAIIPGVGAQQSALSEGISDYLAATMVDDSGMGRGFFYSDDPLRELDPEGSEWTWPQDKGESHAEGRIIGGTLWDLREALQTKLGDDEGRFHTDMLWYESIRRATDIPTMYPEALLADDDDGDLANGTPNACEINAAFEAHGLRDPTQLGDASVAADPIEDGLAVVLSLSLPEFPDCPLGDGDAELRWRLRGDDPANVTTEPMTIVDGSWTATIPTQAPGEVVEYQIAMTFADGTTAGFPRNDADPWYQAFFGATVPIWCLDQQTDPADWTFAGPGDSWTFGPLDAQGGIDPAMPFDDDGVQLSQAGIYPPYSDTTATGPVVDIRGHRDVRLHYRRWLTVEDAFFDQARIRVNGDTIWTNLATEQTNVHHIDREWRFHDLPLNDFLDAGEAQLQFALTSDGGLHLGGWTLDALCIVEVVPPVCGDGMTSAGEGCDDGNTEDGDGCDASCMEEDPDPTGGDTTTGADTSGGDDESSTGGDDGPDFPMDDGGPLDGGTGESTGGVGEDTETSDGCGCTTDDRRGLPAALLMIVAAVRRRRRTA